MQLIILLIAVVLFLVYAMLIIYYRKAWRSIPSINLSHQPQKFSTTISVIIPARNEAGNIQACLETIAKQTYPEQLFEVFVIDDHSTDDTADIVKAFPMESVK